MAFTEDDHVVETLATYRADHPFDVGILPRAPAGGDGLLDPELVNSTPEERAVDPSRSRIMYRGAVSKGHA